MRIFMITAGAGQMVCGSCLRDGALAAALMGRGHDVLVIPTYTPLHTETGGLAVEDVFFGGVNAWLQYKYALFRHTPRFLDRWLDAAPLLRFVSRFGHMTAARDLARMTITALEGAEGRHRKEIDRLTNHLATLAPPDVVLFSNSLLAGMAGETRKRLGRPVYCMLSGEDLFLEEFPEPWRGQARALLQRRAGECDGLIATNAYYRQMMLTYLAVDEGHIHLARLGVDTRGYPAEPPPPPERFTVGFLTRVCPQKGLRELVAAFHLLRQNPLGADAVLRIAGYLAPEHRSYLQGILNDARRWGLGEAVRYEGALSRAEKIAFLSGLSVFCVPSQFPESKAQFVPEALAAGAPVVLPRTGCFPEWVEGTGGGLLCEAGSPEALAGALAQMVADPAEARRMGLAGRQAVLERFRSEDMADSILTVFAQKA